MFSIKQNLGSISVMASLRLTFIPAAALAASQLVHNPRFSPLFLKLNEKLPFNRLFAQKARASSTAFESTQHQQKDSTFEEKKVGTTDDILACPVCYGPLIWNGSPITLCEESTAESSLLCRTCKKSYQGNASHIDLTVGSGGKTYGETIAASTELFRLPLISFLYERGWRQSFNILGGFLGPEKEFELMKNYLSPVLGGNIIDASCGSGLFARLFAKSGLFSRVVALDFSESMLQQCYEFIKKEQNFPEENLLLVRADISRLPFASSSIDAVHAGAALHCWPSPSAAVAEISRVLRPGGVFVATTYILDGPFSLFPLNPFIRPLRENFAALSGSHIFLAERELEDLCASCGLEDFTCTRNRRFVMISAKKPR